MTSDLQLVEALLERVMPNPQDFAERVVQEAVDRFTAAGGGGESPAGEPAYDSTAQEMLSDRNILLAAALGACECWGANPACENCLGQGAPGWVTPDTALFAEYVEPAVARSGARSDTVTEGAHT